MLSLHASCGVEACAEFEDCEKTIMELKLLPLKTLYDWMVANGCFSFLILLEFPLISLLLLDLLVHLLYTSCVPELDLCVTNEFNLLNPKEKKKISLLKYSNNQFFRGLILIKDTVGASLVPVYEKC